MAIYILAFIFASFIYVIFLLLKINKRLRTDKQVSQDNYAALQSKLVYKIHVIENLLKLTSKQAVEITKLQTKLGMYNE